MKNLIIFLTTITTGVFGIRAANTVAETAMPNNTYSDAHGFIFTEGGVTFSVFPNGEFDFYYHEGFNPKAHTTISFNAGYNYNNMVQYDHYGAVIQIGNIPVFYDFYGRVSGIGAIPLYYNNGYVSSIGNLHIFYTPYGVYSHCSGYINAYNVSYSYMPFHRYFVRPAPQFCMVYYTPYRRHYTPVRYTYYKPYLNNIRHCYATVGATYYYKTNPQRTRIYKNDTRVTRRTSSYPEGENGSRRASAVSQKGNSRRNASVQPYRSRMKNENRAISHAGSSVSDRYYTSAEKSSLRKSTRIEKTSRNVRDKATDRSVPRKGSSVSGTVSDNTRRGIMASSRGRNTRSKR